MTKNENAKNNAPKKMRMKKPYCFLLIPSNTCIYTITFKNHSELNDSTLVSIYTHISALYRNCVWLTTKRNTDIIFSMNKTLH